MLILKIRELIDLLEELERVSQKKDLTEVNVRVNLGGVVLWSPNCSFLTEIQDVDLVFGEKNDVQIDVIATPENIEKMYFDYEKYHKNFNVED